MSDRPTSSGRRTDDGDPALRGESPSQGSLVAMSRPGVKLPLHVVHGAGGGIYFLREFAASLDGVRQVYGLRAHSLDNPAGWDRSIEAMVERYVDEIIAAHPGPYLLGGYSSGGTIALEMAALLQQRGHEVPLLVLFECWPRGDATQPRAMRHLRLLRYLITDGYRPVSGYLKHIGGERVLRLKSRLFRGSPQPPVLESLPVPERDDVHEFYRQTLDLLSEFEFSVYDVPAFLLKADVYWPHLPRDYRWRRLLRQPLRIQIVEGHHITMWWHPHALTLAVSVDEILDDAYRPPP